MPYNVHAIKKELQQVAPIAKAIWGCLAWQSLGTLFYMSNYCIHHWHMGIFFCWFVLSETKTGFALTVWVISHEVWRVSRQWECDLTLG